MSPTITETLRSYFVSHREQPRRPILTSLNGDGSWLMSFPLPSGAPMWEKGSRKKRFYHVVVDPWLKGPATMVSPWLVFIERTEPAAVSDADGVEALVREIEELAAAAQGQAFEDSDAQPQQPLVDAIFIKVHLLDHLHRPTLETFDKRIPVFATAEAAPIIRDWGHFDTVVDFRDYRRYDGDNCSAENSPGASDVSTADRVSHWKSFHPGYPLPEWLNVFRLVGDWYVELATVLVWSHESHSKNSESGTGNEQHEFIINTPHGVDVNTESVVAFFEDNGMNNNNNNTARGNAQPGSVATMDCLAMLAGLKDSYSFGMRETVGVERSLQLERKAEPKYWVKSHDLPLRVSGAMMRIRMTKEVIRTLEYGLEEEAKARLKRNKEDDLRKPNLVKVGNGSCFVLH